MSETNTECFSSAELSTYLKKRSDGDKRQVLPFHLNCQETAWLRKWEPLFEKKKGILGPLSAEKWNLETLAPN